MKKKLNNELMKLKKTTAFYSKTLEMLPAGKLTSSLVQGRSIWRVTIGGKRKYLSKKCKEFAVQLAQKRYLLEMTEHLQQQIACLEHLEKLYADEKKCEIFYFGDESAYSELLREKYPQSKEWSDMAASLKSNQNMYHNENLKFLTTSGHKVRSKIEVIVDDILFSMKLTFVYEPELVISGQKYYPDFIVIDEVEKKLTIIEIFGMMDDQAYSTKAVEKMDLYSRNGYLLGDNFLPFFETSKCPLNPASIKKVLVNHFY